MKNENKFSVSRFTNRNGVPSWRAAGWLCGIRIRKNFKTKEEAAAEKGTLELKALQATAGLRSAITFLADAQIREAEDAFRRLDGRPRSLLFYLDYLGKALWDAVHSEHGAGPPPEFLPDYQTERRQKLWDCEGEAWCKRRVVEQCLYGGRNGGAQRSENSMAGVTEWGSERRRRIISTRDYARNSNASNDHREGPWPSHPLLVGQDKAGKKQAW